MTTHTPDPELVLHGSAASQGYRMPAEWEPQECVWLVRPHNEETWPGCLDAAQREWDAFRAELSRVVEVRETSELGIATNDSWIRDFGPIFVRRGGEVAGHSFVFNGWGDKYEPRTLDNAVPDAISARWRIPMWRHQFVLEGGSIDVNGAGTVLTTLQCLENDNRNPDAARGQIERVLHDALGVTHIVWLPGGIKGDDTDGHIDDIARFVAPNRIVALRAPASHPDHDVLEQNWLALEAARNERGQPFELVAL
ncbi:MAG: agmatine deiminase family protein, partial [Phycisphaerae bacterium]|nr:agmatine deiminase family protein [Phycisphaerae bacterium]